MPDLLRLILCSLLFSCSLLVIFRAPTYSLWKLQVGITEYPHVMILLSAIAFGTRYFDTDHRLLGDILSLTALFLFTYPIVSAIGTSARTKISFPGSGSKPFSLSRLFLGFGNKKRAPKTVSYKKNGNTELKLDLYHSHSNEPSPCILVVHGGGWDSGNKEQLPGLNHYLAQKGFHVACISYRLAPEHKCPAPVEDVNDAIEFLKSNAGDLKIDTNRFVLLGRSAGGQIALLHAYSKQLPEIKGVISFYAPSDMVWGWSIPGNPLVLDSRATMSAYLGGTCEEIPEKFTASSPIEFVNENCPPTLLIHGTHECMVAHEHSVRLSEKLKKKNVEHYLLTLPWATHGCDYNISGPSGQISTFAIESFLKKILN